MKNSSRFVISALLLSGGLAQGQQVHAADAIVVEPEPIEYVRVCDAYGSGYFYLPGTETCLNINGYVRTTYTHIEREINRGHDVDGDISEVDGDVADGTKLNGSKWTYRGRLNIQAKNETEYGTLSSYLRLQGTGDGYGDANELVDQAYISLAGFRAGHGDEFFKRNSNGGAGVPAIYDGYYDDARTNYAEYTFDFDGFSLTGGVEQKPGGYSRNNVNAYGGIKYQNEFMKLAFTAVRDSDYDDTAYKASAIFDLNDWELGGWYAWEDDGTGRYVNGNLYGRIGTHVLDEEWGVQLNGKLTESLLVYGLYSEASGQNQNTSADVDDETFQYWTIGASWEPVSQLHLVVEYNNEKRKADLGVGAVYNDESDRLAFRAIRSW